MKNNWSGKRILIIGAARQGLALARFLSERGADVILNDHRSIAQMKDEMESLKDTSVNWALGDHTINLLENVDLVSLSGGVPLTLPIVQEAIHREILLTNDAQIFLQEVSDSVAGVIGITGSAGKTTTTTLVGRMAGSAVTPPQAAWVGGNIGNPLISDLDRIKPADLVVMELSSFQLDQMTVSPHIACILNITPNHLDRHGTMTAYISAKARLLDFQISGDIAVLNREDRVSWKLNPRVKGKLVTFGQERPEAGLDGTFVEEGMILFQQGSETETIMPVANIKLRGQHNLMNVLSACAVAHAAGFPIAAMEAALVDFTGVAHRLEFVASRGGASWYNDSIATAPERAMAAVQAFDEPLVLMLGGRDKKLPWDDLAKLIHHRVDHVITFGELSPLVTTALGPLQQNHRPYSLTSCKNLEDAVLAAREVASAGDVVLLSPGGTSFDEFKDFEERGERFRGLVRQLK
ncbi:MAG: UDP-N-acetylmuramoyl-L-alanine--D-glutamate ligase [Anaerolineaceae bacterium]